MKMEIAAILAAGLVGGCTGELTGKDTDRPPLIQAGGDVENVTLVEADGNAQASYDQSEDNSTGE